MVNVFPDKVFGGWTLDSAPKGVNKWSGVEAYCRYRDLDPGAVLAIGDGDNDVELFERAAHSCAMSHATERARRRRTSPCPAAWTAGPSSSITSDAPASQAYQTTGFAGLAPANGRSRAAAGRGAFRPAPDLRPEERSALGVELPA